MHEQYGDDPDLWHDHGVLKETTMAEQDPIDRLLQREDTGTSRTKGTMDEARQATSEMARPETTGDDRGGLTGMFRSLSRASSRKNPRDSRE